MSKIESFFNTLFKRGSQAPRSFYILFVFIAVVVLGGGHYFWKGKETAREIDRNVPLASSSPTHSPSPVPSLPVDEITTSEDEETSDENEDEENAPAPQSPWTLLKTALPSRYDERAIQTQAPSVVLIFTGLGLNKAWTDHVLTTLKKKSTLVFSPYSPNISDQLQQAANLGHQVLIALPMEPYHFPNPDPGPLTILTGVTAEENICKTKAVLEKAPKGAITGVMGEYGSRFTASQTDLEPVLNEIKKQGLVFIDPHSSLHSQVRPVCMALEMACHTVDLPLPLVADATEVDEFLKKITQNAKENGIVIVSVPAIPVFIDRLLEWMDDCEKNGINFVTIADKTFTGEHQGTTDAHKQEPHQPR